MQIQKKLVAKLKMNYTLRVLLFTDSKTEATRMVDTLTEEQQKTYKKYLTRKYPKHRQFWAGRLDVSMGSDEFFAGVKDKLVIRGARGREWRELHRICMTDATFKKREQTAHGYLDAIMILGYDREPEVAGAAPIATRKRTGDKLMIQYRYCLLYTSPSPRD